MKSLIRRIFGKSPTVPILFIIVIIVGILSIGIFFILKNGESNPTIENGSVLKGNTTDESSEDRRVKDSKQVAADKIEEIIKGNEVVVIDNEKSLNNPVSNENFEMTEDEWEYIKGEVDKKVKQYRFSDANDILNKRVIGLDLEKYEFGVEIRDLHNDINKLAFIETTYDTQIAPSDVGAAVMPIISQSDPERALMASIWLSVNVITEVILNQDSLVPIRDGVPMISKVEDLKDEHYLREINTTYKATSIKLINFKLDEYPLQAIVLGFEDGVYQVWRIIQGADGEAPYQNVKFWKNYLQQVAPKGAKTEVGTGHGFSHDESYIDDNDDADYQKYLKSKEE